MIYYATTSTADGRLTAGKRYVGMSVFNKDGQARIAVYDNKSEVMTFNPKVLIRLNEHKGNSTRRHI